MFMGHVHPSFGLDYPLAFSERRNIPKPPTDKTKIVIRSNAVIVLKLKWSDEITPNIKAINEPQVSIQPIMLFPL